MFLHIIQAHDLANPYHGTYKDVISRVDWLKRRFSNYQQILVTKDDPELIDTAWTFEIPLEGAIVEYSYYPRIVKRLKQRAPQACVAVRSINLEPLQHFNNHGWWPRRGPIWMLYGMARLALSDVQTKRHANAILSINEWENRVYWDRLPGRAKVAWLPYRCPDHLLPPNPLPYEQRKVIACLPTSQKNRKSWDLVLRFQQFAKEMKRMGCENDFFITGEVKDWGLPECPEVTYTGFVDNLADFMGSCRAIAILSPLGYGFKTTIADAFAAGAHVVAHPDLVRRNPQMVKPFLLSCDSHLPHEVQSVLGKLSLEPHGTGLHQKLCERADSVMNHWLGEFVT